MVAPVRWATPAKEVLWQYQPDSFATSINQLVSTPPPSPPRAATSILIVFWGAVTTVPTSLDEGHVHATNCGCAGEIHAAVALHVSGYKQDLSGKTTDTALRYVH